MDLRIVGRNLVMGETATLRGGERGLRPPVPALRQAPTTPDRGDPQDQGEQDAEDDAESR